MTRPGYLTWAAAGLLLLAPLTTSCGKENSAPAAPAPTPTPVPAPTPTPAPTPITNGCGLPKGSGTGNGCPRTSPTFLAQVDRAINEVVAANPGLFDLNDQRGAGGFLIRPGNRNRFYAEVVNNLNRMGLCAVDDGVEAAVKNVNSFSDQYRIDLSTGHIRRGDSSYRATCFPAWF